MKFALITPPGGAELFRMHRLGYHMALAQRLIDDPDYLKMYRCMRFRQSGGFIIVDNGAAEADRRPFDEVVEVANKIEADEIIMPDELRDGAATFQMSTDYAAQDLVPIQKRMIVPQGVGIGEWVDCLVNIRTKMEFATIGVAKHLRHAHPNGRAGFLQAIQDMGYHKRYHVHLLGMNGIAELSVLKEMFPWVRGVDSGMPVAYAQRGLPFTLANEHYGLEWDNDFNVNIASGNLDILLALCRKEDVICT